jgi:hypothetical protein
MDLLSLGSPQRGIRHVRVSKSWTPHLEQRREVESAGPNNTTIVRRHSVVKQDHQTS